MRQLGMSVVALCLTAAFGGATEISPIYGLQVLGGQNFYTGARNSLSGNFTGVVAPAMKFNDNWALLPSVNSSYQGTEQVLDVVGAGTLFQSQWDNRLGARAVYTPTDSPWRIKPSASVKYEFLQQTKDESLGAGLYDYMKYDAGVDFEYVYKDPFSVHFGLDAYLVHFPNYTSLESQVATSFQGQSLARELVGNYVLDTQNLLVTAGMEGALSERFILEGSAAMLLERFPNQHLVDPSGNLTQPLRQDVIPMVGGSLKMPTELNSDLRMLGALDVSLSYDSSNQNNFDATATTYIPYYYNYGEFRFSPNAKFLIGPPKTATVVGLSATYLYRRYPYRQIQDPSSGVYQGGSTHQNNLILNASLNYPMAPHFGLLFNVQYGRATSNQSFQQYYTYNYTATNYLFGFSYDY